MKDLKYYLVQGKTDDYVACLTEVVRTTQANAEEYYSHREIEESDIEVLFKFFDLVDFEEESKRTGEKRYFGGD